MLPNNEHLNDYSLWIFKLIVQSLDQKVYKLQIIYASVTVSEKWLSEFILFGIQYLCYWFSEEPFC